MTDIHDIAVTVVLFIFMFGVVLLNGTVGGILIARKSLWNIPNFYVIAFSFYNILVGIFVFISTIVRIFLSPTSSWCWITRFIYLFAFASGIFFAMGVIVNRYRSLLYPLTYIPTEKGAICKIISVIIVAFLYSLRCLVALALRETGSVYYNNTDVKPATDHGDLCNIFIEEVHFFYWFRIADFILLFFIPIVSIVVMWRNLSRKLFNANLFTNVILRRKRKAVKISMAVGLTFLCWLPSVLLLFIHETLDRLGMPHLHDNSYQVIQDVTMLLAMLQTIISPIIYALFDTRFQQELWIIKTKVCCPDRKEMVLPALSEGCDVSIAHGTQGQSMRDSPYNPTSTQFHIDEPNPKQLNREKKHTLMPDISI